jgi:hypothetical protein
MRPKVAEAWLAFLRERQPHKRLELQHLKGMLTNSPRGQSTDQAVRRLRTLATQYPDVWTVFQTQQRLLGTFKVEDFQ